jgi:5-methyltetrahydrofolate--homocysteine methyltransferase
MSANKLNIIGDRINPGFRSSKALFDNSDIEGIQNLAVRQVEAGAYALDVNIGPRALQEKEFMVEVIRALQDVVSVPLAFDSPDIEVQEVCLRTYDDQKANGQKPIVNSIAEPRAEMLELLKIRPFKVILMASERMEDGVGKPNQRAREVYEVTKRMSKKILQTADLTTDDIIVDVSISALATDTKGLTKMALDGIRMISEDPDLEGIHIMGGLTNIGQMLPPKEIDGENLKSLIERAFLTVAMPLGFDTVLITPWHNLSPLPQDNELLRSFKEVIELTGGKALRGIRSLYAD